MPFFNKLFIFTSGIISGTYLEQKYKFPNIEQKVGETINFIKNYKFSKPKNPPRCPPSSVIIK